MDQIINTSPELQKTQPKKINIKKIILLIALAVAFAAFFGLGLWLGLHGEIPYCENISQPGTISFSLFWDAYNKLHDKFVDPSKIDDQKVLYGAIEGMTKSLGDPYTDFFDPAQAKMFEQNLSGSFEGIGVQIGITKEALTVIAPLPETPGEKAGIKAGDIIVKIDGKDSTNMTTDEAVTLIRGPKGTAVTLTIVREGWTSTKDFKIVRETIIIPSIKWSLKDGNVAYIQIFQFDENLGTDFKKTALEILASPAKKIVLDLRNDPGGYLEVCKDIAGWFLKKDQTITIEDFGAGKTQTIYKADGNASLENYPVVVLIDKGSASASEILAGALRDNRNVKLIGEKSFGKGSVQEVVDLKGGSFLKITIAKWLTPKGNSISEIGLTPDIKVDITDQDIENKKDPQLDKALEIIKGMQ
ncbi:MAG: S41 family peptidase [Candidatus Staskawiczbacteria bacterium]|nr:S41 family peptidase [Candidatus Staskawiczbacteria bacterium]